MNEAESATTTTWPVQKWARFYTQGLGLQVVPLAPGKKACKDEGWQELKFKPSDFRDNDNIGIKSRDGLVIIDVDADEAIKMADAFLPRTDPIYGRKSKPRAKRLYRSKGVAKLKQYKHDNKTLVELRVNHQDMAPPSIHPEGEQLTWEPKSWGKPTEIDVDELMTAVKLLATASLIARYWPKEGRHNLRLAYSRVLLETLKLPAETAIKVLENACRVGGSDVNGIEDVQRAVHDTAAKLETDEPTRGIPSLREALPGVGEKIVKSLCKWFDVSRPFDIFDRGDPRTIAQVFASRHWAIDGFLAARNQNSLFYRWTVDTNAYREIEDASVKAEVWRFLAQGKRYVSVSGWKEDEDKIVVSFAPNRKDVGEVLEALRGLTHHSKELSAPYWLEGHGPTDVLAFRNGLLNIKTRELLPPTPKYYNHVALTFDYEPSPSSPEGWLAFLQSLWPSDADAIRKLQEIFGYLVVGETKFQKIFMLIGPKRSGKGTIARVLRELIGPPNYASPTLHSFSEPFGRQCLINKRLAVFPDARITKRTNADVIVEELLSFSGEDPKQIQRKHMADWEGLSYVRFLMLTNELPQLEDASGALASRFEILTLEESFYGREDLGLFYKLRKDLPGILTWALDGWDRLRERGHFEKLASSEQIVEEFEKLGSPVSGFVDDRCEVNAAASVERDAVWVAWQSWCEKNKRVPGTSSTFFRDLKSAIPKIRKVRRGGRGNQVWFLAGIELKKHEEAPF